MEFRPRPRTKRRPFGYLEHKDYVLLDSHVDFDLEAYPPASFFFPHPEALTALEAAYDQLDAGASYREVIEFLNATVSPFGFSLTTMGLLKLRKIARPNYTPKVATQKKSTRRSREDRVIYNRKKRIAIDKTRIIAAQKRIKKNASEVDEVLGLKKLDKQDIRMVEASVEYDFGAIPEEDKEHFVFIPNPGPQTTFLAASEKQVLYGGAAGGGKSFALLADPMRYFHIPEFNGVIFRRRNDELRELIWKSKMLYSQAFPKAHFSVKSSTWEFPAGGHLWFTYLESDDDLLRYQGQSFSWIGFDELTQYPTPNAWNYLYTRLRSTEGSLDTVMRATSNPGGPGHGWVKRMFIDPADYGKAFWAQDEDSKTIVYPATYTSGPNIGQPHPQAGQPIFQRRFIPASLYDNPYLLQDGQYEAALMSQKESLRRQLLEGDWDVADGAAFPEFRRHIHVCNPQDVNIGRDWFRFRSCDYGYSSTQASAVHWYAVDPISGTIYVYRELYVYGHTGRDLGIRVRAMEGDERISYGVLDASTFGRRGNTGPSIAEEMIKAGTKWKASDRTPNSRIAGKNRLHELLKVDPISGKPGIIFLSNCRQIISDLPVIPQSREDDDIDQKFMSDHAYDSIRYGVMSRPSRLSWDAYPKTERSFIPVDRTFGY